MNDSPSSTSEGQSGGPPTSTAYPRPSNAPSLARTSISTHATTEEQTLGGGEDSYYSSWEQSDIRSDLAAGWGEDISGAALAVAASRSEISHNNSTMDEDNNDDNNNNNEDDWGWRLNKLAVQPVPSFYPMDARSTRRITLSNNSLLVDQAKTGGGEEVGVVASLGGGFMEEDDHDVTTLSSQCSHTIEEISHRISTACQKLSIHGLWDNTCPSATLSSMERVEMEINFYLDNNSNSSSVSGDLGELMN